LDHLFERFYRGDKSRQREAGGSGLGLAIAKSLVEAQGGQIKVASKPGVGATFIIELPV
jgi:two-component system OmpR family sensor kinase